MRRVGARAVVVVLCLLAGAATVDAAVRFRLPVGAGVFYPADVENLRAAVKTYLAEADGPDVPGRMAACIVPVAGYPTVGAVMGHAFQYLRAGDYDRVIVLTPSHGAGFSGLSVPGVEGFRMLWGMIPIDGPAIHSLSGTQEIAVRSLVYNPRAYNDPQVNRVALHEQEYGYELPLPFLQECLGEFKLVPVVIGDLTDDDGLFEQGMIDSVVDAFRGIMTSRTLVVLAANLTHFGNTFGYRPFDDDVQARITALDFDLIDVIKTRNNAALERYIRETGNRVPGISAFALFMRLIPDNSMALLLDYTTSGRINKSDETSVSYAAMGFFVPASRGGIVRAAAPQGTGAGVAEAAQATEKE